MPAMIERIGHFLDPGTTIGALVLAGVCFLLCSIGAVLVRRASRRVERNLSDVTVLKFVTVFVQSLLFLVGLVLYAHMVPGLRAFGTALLAGASVASVVVGLAAQDTLGNLIAGFSLVLSRSVRVGDAIRLYCPVGVIEAKVEVISLGFTALRDKDGNEVVVPNSVMMSSAILRLAPSQPAASGSE